MFILKTNLTQIGDACFPCIASTHTYTNIPWRWSNQSRSRSFESGKLLSLLFHVHVDDLLCSCVQPYIQKTDRIPAHTVLDLLSPPIYAKRLPLFQRFMLPEFGDTIGTVLPHKTQLSETHESRPVERWTETIKKSPNLSRMQYWITSAACDVVNMRFYSILRNFPNMEISSSQIWHLSLYTSPRSPPHSSFG